MYWFLTVVVPLGLLVGFYLAKRLTALPKGRRTRTYGRHHRRS